MNSIRDSFRPLPLAISMALVLALYYGLNQFDSRAIYASWDKWLHGAVFFLIWWLALWSLRWSALWVSLLVIAAGGAEELHQLWQADHMPDLKDWYADMVGVALAAGIYSLGQLLWAMKQSVKERDSTPEMPLREDPFVRNLLTRLPEESKDSFSDEQLQALKLALGGRNWSSHLLDWRWTLAFWRWHYYFVFLAGHNR
ncbi:MAG: VanZ family protein, partial [Methylococcaceae bacterium]|nr:VanZ family protein [Methylococcaceae bacterium]